MNAAEAPTTEDRITLIRAGIGGALMGLANLVPGISGGTMLLAAGVYTQFIRAIAELSTFRFRVQSMVTVGVIVGAAVLAIGLLAGAMGELVINQRWIMYSIFIGLTLGGVPLLLEMLRPVSSGAVFMSIVGIAVMGVMAVTRPGAMAADEGTLAAFRIEQRCQAD